MERNISTQTNPMQLSARRANGLDTECRPLFGGFHRPGNPLPLSDGVALALATEFVFALQ